MKYGNTFWNWLYSYHFLRFKIQNPLFMLKIQNPTYICVIFKFGVTDYSKTGNVMLDYHLIIPKIRQFILKLSIIILFLKWGRKSKHITLISVQSSIAIWCQLIFYMYLDKSHFTCFFFLSFESHTCIFSLCWVKFWIYLVILFIMFVSWVWWVDL